MTLIGPSREGCANLIGEHRRQRGQCLLVQFPSLVGSLEDHADRIQAFLLFALLLRRAQHLRRARK
jgi:hypothetical protein